MQVQDSVEMRSDSYYSFKLYTLMSVLYIVIYYIIINVKYLKYMDFNETVKT